MNRSFFSTLFVAGTLVFLSGCFFSGGSETKTSSLKVINVLDKEFFDDCHIPGSIQIPMMDVLKTAEKEKWPQSTKIVVYCSNYACTASTTVCRQLMKEGFTDVWDYEAGIAGWYQEKLPVEGPAKAGYLMQENKPLEGVSSEGVQVISTEELRKTIEGE